MGVPAGLLNRRLTVLRRQPVPVTGSVARGGFVAEAAPLWAAFRVRGTQAVTVGGLTLTVAIGVVTLRDDTRARGLSNADRIVVDGTTFEILSQEAPERPDGSLRFNVIAARTPDLYAREMEMRGTVVTLRRMVNASPVNALARAIITGYRPEELSGGIDVGQRRVIVLAEDLVKNGYPVPPTKYDKVLVQAESRQMSILSVDDWTHRDADVQHAYEIQAAG